MDQSENLNCTLVWHKARLYTDRLSSLFVSLPLFCILCLCFLSISPCYANMHYARSYLDSCNQGRERRATVGRFGKASKPSREGIKRGLNVATKTNDARSVASQRDVTSRRVASLERALARLKK